ncbi:hypothetical protein FPV67DRAFT_1455377 [Lyophyllum atratum]|nr:hypothetical protein FPV67DRAFT_1455377 [Lyophyllum atratum]
MSPTISPRDSNQIDLVEALNSTPPYFPVPLSATTASSTRGPSLQEIQYWPRERLAGIVFQPFLADQLVEQAILIADDTKVDPANIEHAQWLARINPANNCSLLSPVINSEQDTRDWVMAGLLYPALAVLRLCCGEALCITRDPRTDMPYLASSQVVPEMPIPDQKLFEKIPKNREFGAAKTVQTFEFKTDNALDIQKFSDLLTSRSQLEFDTVPESPLAIPFVWPDDESTVDKLTRMIIQVYSQMWKNRAQQGILTSFRSTLFFYLNLKTRILHISKVYDFQIDPTLGVVFAWFLSTFDEEIRAELHLVEPDMTCIQEFADTAVKSRRGTGAQTQFCDDFLRELKKPRPADPRNRPKTRAITEGQKKHDERTKKAFNDKAKGEKATPDSSSVATPRPATRSMSRVDTEDQETPRAARRPATSRQTMAIGTSRFSAALKSALDENSDD